jgi:hypothetical protein
VDWRIKNKNSHRFDLWENIYLRRTKAQLSFQLSSSLAMFNLRLPTSLRFTYKQHSLPFSLRKFYTYIHLTHQLVITHLFVYFLRHKSLQDTCTKYYIFIFKQIYHTCVNHNQYNSGFYLFGARHTKS